MMKTRILKKALSMLLTAAMVLNLGLIPAFAESAPLGSSGLTDCHVTHDRDCGYDETVPTPCAHTCAVCTPGDKQPVQDLIALVDALPGAGDITEDNRDAALPDFEAAGEAYSALNGENKAAFEAAEQYKKLMALLTTLYAVAPMANEATHDISNGALVLDSSEGTCRGHIVTGTTKTHNIQVTGGTHDVTLNNINITSNSAFAITGNATVNLTLTGANTLKSESFFAGLQVEGGNTLIITAESSGSLSATGGFTSAGIGGSGNGTGSGGNITINGGTIIANGVSSGGAGIGGVGSKDGGKITINGGTVTATGHSGAAGIGGGSTSTSGSSSTGGAGGDITITGGTVIANGGTNGASVGGAGIGSGGGSSGTGAAGGNITITGGTVTAKGGSAAAGIGGGRYGASGIITISGNSTAVFAEGSILQASHIGKGFNSVDETVNRSGGIIFEGKIGKIYGTEVVKPGNLSLSDVQTLTIEEGKTLEIGKGVTIRVGNTLNNNGTLILNGTLTGVGSYANLNNTGSLKSSFVVGDIRSIPNQVYTGTRIEPAITLTRNNPTAMGQTFVIDIADYTKTYESNVNAGEAKVVFTKGSNKIEKTFNIVQSGTTFTGGVTADKSAYTYGETITVTAKPKATGVATFSLTSPTASQMALYVGDKQISNAVNADASGVYTMTYNTTDKGLAIGSHTITAKYVGNSNMADHTGTVTVTLNQKALSAAADTSHVSASKEYDGNANFHSVALNLTGVESGDADSVHGSADGTASDANAGGNKFFTASSPSVSGTSSGYYSLAVENISGTVSITQKALTITGGTVTPKKWNGNRTAAVTALTFSGLVNGETLEIDADYTWSGTLYDNANVGTGKTVTGTASLKETTKAGNYSLTGAFSITGGEITLGDSPAAPTDSVVDDAKGTDTFGFAAVPGHTDLSEYEYSTDGGSSWAEVTANPIVVGNIVVAIGDLQVRVKATANYKAGEILSNATAFTASIVGRVGFSGSFGYGSTVYATVQEGQDGASFHYQWKAGETNIGTDSMFLTVPGEAVGKIINVEVTADGYADSLVGDQDRITEKKVLNPGFGAISKTYDGTNTVEAEDLNLTINKVNESDDITVTVQSATYNDANAGTGKRITFGEFTLTGKNKDWYSVNPPLNVTGEITPKPLTTATVTVKGIYEYTGTPQTPSAENVIVKVGGTTLTHDTDYTYTASNNADIGTATVTVTFKGNYSGTANGTFDILKVMVNTSVSINSFEDTSYTGNAVANPPEESMTITGASYSDVQFTYYADNSGTKGEKIDAPKNAGTYYVEASIEATEDRTESTSEAVKFSISPAPLTITGGTVTPREYDGTTAATVTALTFGGLKNGETLAITTDYTAGTPVYDSADAGTNKTVSGTAVLESNAKTSNYTLTGVYSITNQTIAKKTGIAAPTYDAMDDTTTAKSFTFGTVSGYDTVTEYEWKLDTDADTAWTAVTANPITFGNRAGKMQVRVKGTTNYEAGAILTHSTAFTATLEGSVSIEGTATYGETLTAKATDTQTGAVLSYEWKSGATVLQAKSANNTYKIAGTAVGDTITVEVTAEGYTGSLTDTTTAVAKRSLTATPAVQSKEYDGNTTASVRFTFGSGEVISGDTVTAAATGTFADKNVGDGKTVNITGFVLGGAAKDYYTVTTPPTTATANITAKALTVGDGTLAITKEYDTTTAFTASTGSLGLTGAVGREAVVVKIDSYGAAADANVGTKTISLGISLDEADKDNYTVTSPYAFTKAKITQKETTPTVTVTGSYTYTGSQIQPTITVKDGDTTIPADNYTVSYGANINAGTDAGSVAVTLKGNYNGTANITFTINKASGLTATTPGNIQMVKGQEKAYTFDLSTIVLNKADAGTKTYALSTLTNSNSIFKAVPSISGAEMTFTSNSIATPAANQATQVVTISTQNYVDTSVTLTFDIIDKTTVAITGLSAATTLVYNGAAQDGYTGTAGFSPAWSGTLTYTYYQGTGTDGTKLSGAPTHAGTYTVVAAIPDADPDYAGSHSPITFTIGAKEITASKGDYKVSKPYDGTTGAGTGSGTLGFTGTLPKDSGVSVVPGTIPAYSDSAVKADYEIALPISISGDTNSNYKLAASTVTVPGEITKASVTVTIDSIDAVDYTGSQIKPAVTVKVGGSSIADTNYTVEYGANVNTGTGSVTVKAKATGNYTFAEVSATFTINKAAGAAIGGDITGSYTGDGTGFTYTVASISGAEYKMDNGAWQDSGVFSGITPMGTHTFSARMKETTNYEAGAVKSGAQVEFVKLAGPAAPALTYTVSHDGDNKTIAITKVSGAEYQFGAAPWSATNEKVYATEETITIGIRMKATATHNEGIAATASVNLAKLEQDAPAAFTLTYVANGETDYTVTIPEVADCEYSFDGITYGDTRTKIANVGDTVTGYMRKAATNTHNASPAVTASVTLPMFKVKPVTASPNGGSFTGSVSVILSSDTVGADIHYTTDGTIPGASSAKYTESLTLTTDTTVKAIAVKAGMTDSDVATFTFSKQSSSTSGGGSGSSGNSSTILPPDPNKPNAPTTAELKVTVKTDKNGKATAAVASADITNAIDKAQKEAKKNGAEANGIAISLDVNADKTATALGVTLAQKSIAALIAANVTAVTVKNGLATVTLDLAALKALAGGDVVLTISKADVATLSPEARTAIGNRPLLQFGLTSGGKTVSDFKGGRADLRIPYTPTAAERAENLCGVYVDADGKVNWLETGSYDAATGAMLISAQHFSIYGIGYKQSTPEFTDVGDHWAKSDIDFVVARGLLLGTSSTTFAPDQSMTRGMFVTVLGRLAGVDTNQFSGTKFTDVKADAYYAPYVAWANANHIVNGTGDTTFSPDAAISRQEMAVMLANYSQAAGYTLPDVYPEAGFADADSIGAWARDAVKQMQMAGILMGKSGNRFDPTATANRAEVSTMLRRYVELAVDTQTTER